MNEKIKPNFLDFFKLNFTTCQKNLKKSRTFFSVFRIFQKINKNISICIFKPHHIHRTDPHSDWSIFEIFFPIINFLKQKFKLKFHQFWKKRIFSKKNFFQFFVNFCMIKKTEISDFIHFQRNSEKSEKKWKIFFSFNFENFFSIFNYLPILRCRSNFQEKKKMNKNFQILKLP